MRQPFVSWRIAHGVGTPSVPPVARHRESKVARKYALTDRESDVAHWLCLGKTNPEIATILAIAPGTVKIHVQNIFAKLGVENRTQAAVALGGE